MPSSRKTPKTHDWPRKVRVGRQCVTVYKRATPSGGTAYMVANYSTGKRRFDCYASAEIALEEAKKLARRLSEREVIAAALTNAQAVEYAGAVEALKPFGLKLGNAVPALVECLNIVGDLSSLQAAVKRYASVSKQVVPIRVSEVVSELLLVKDARNASKRYQDDLRSRLSRFAGDFTVDLCDVTAAQIQGWLDRMKIKAQTYMNFRTVLHQLFEFGLARNYCAENPVAQVEKQRVRDRDIEIFSPDDIRQLLDAASDEFLPCLAIGAFAGLRSSEIELLDWADIDLESRHIVVRAEKAKTATRRVVPICENLAAWLAPYAEGSGKIWKAGHDAYYEEQRRTALATGERVHGKKTKRQVKWKSNALRHSYATYRFALIGDAGRVAGELGNSAAIVHRHYREIAKPTEAERWFGICP